MHNRKFVSVFDEQRILSCFPIMIRREIILEANKAVIDKVSIFDSRDVSLIINVMNYLNPAFFSAGQYIYRSSDEGVKAIMFLLDGIAEEVPDTTWEEEANKADGMASPSIRKLYSFNQAMEVGGKDGLNTKNREKLGKQGSLPQVDQTDDEKRKADSAAKAKLDRKIIESGKCFGYQSFLDASEVPTVAYRAFSSCSVMILQEADLKVIIERHPVLRDKLQRALKTAIQKQTANDEVLNQQVNKLQKKNSLFAALQVGLKKVSPSLPTPLRRFSLANPTFLGRQDGQPRDRHRPGQDRGRGHGGQAQGHVGGQEGLGARGTRGPGWRGGGRDEGAGNRVAQERLEGGGVAALQGAALV